MSESPYGRVSENERERALRELSEHFSIGRLTAPEFDERSTAVWAAVSRRQLAETFADLPASPTVVPGAEIGPIPARVVRVVAAAIFAIVLWLTLGNTAWLLLLAAIPLALLVRTRLR
ncbi:DUF1707 domain-containing protein [Nocardia sp. NBC_01503]|uniref:DUF1707 SHOCT-like domain-containing protein n=1 Tax=Nocardia sp. NBC_01503 TaxID=2975997 RepID=UPI002E7B3E25|nr:DUF1707 domain-containing protein [Nocardia sp. NBC_01503]WTL29929.1 DUF1707 domain-containing protein [Nocardia sp. NBC_01503]